jgi:hypothetical protein
MQVGVDVSAGWKRPRYPFQDRVTADGSSGFPAEPDRYQADPTAADRQLPRDRARLGGS